MDLGTPEGEGLDLAGSPREPAPAPGLLSWARPKPRRARGRQSPARGAGRLPGRGPAGRAPGSRAGTPRCGVLGVGEREPAGLRVGGAWPPVPAPQPLGAARDGGGGLERTSSSSTGDICSKSGRGERRLTPRSERRGPQQRPTPPAATFGLGADGGGGGRGRSRRVSRVTTPMKFPIVGGGGGC